jgi:hypothetical protein
LCAALITIRGQLLFVVGGEARWRHDPGCDFIPLELPGGAYDETLASAEAIAAVGRRWLGQSLRLVAADATYGPSPAHAIDRLPPRPAPAPLLSLERLAPADPEHGTGIARVTAEVFQATIESMATETPTMIPQPGSAGLLLLSWRAVRAVVRGLPLADLLARDDVTLRLRPGARLPPEALVYLTGEYGERTLLRIAAKYGAQALGKDLEHGSGF